MSAEGPPPGWYNDEQNSRRLRFWNGNEWTDHYQDKPNAPSRIDAATDRASDVASETQKRAEDYAKSRRPFWEEWKDLDPAKKVIIVAAFVVAFIVIVSAYQATKRISDATALSELTTAATTYLPAPR